MSSLSSDFFSLRLSPSFPEYWWKTSMRAIMAFSNSDIWGPQRKMLCRTEQLLPTQTLPSGASGFGSPPLLGLEGVTFHHPLNPLPTTPHFSIFSSQALWLLVAFGGNFNQNTEEEKWGGWGLSLPPFLGDSPPCPGKTARWGDSAGEQVFELITMNRSQIRIQKSIVFLCSVNKQLENVAEKSCFTAAHTYF